MYGKLIIEKDIHKTIQSLKDRGEKLVFTNGCFDLLHAGHIEYLAAAKDLGTKLIVGINDDASVSKLKGPLRPINKLSDRMIMLAAMQCIDYVIPFSEDTPAALIETVRPDILVKGGDYEIETIVGAEQVIADGGMVKIIAFKPGYSSTSIIDKIKKQ